MEEALSLDHSCCLCCHQSTPWCWHGLWFWRWDERGPCSTGFVIGLATNSFCYWSRKSPTEGRSQGYATSDYATLGMLRGGSGARRSLPFRESAPSSSLTLSWKRQLSSGATPPSKFKLQFVSLLRIQENSALVPWLPDLPKLWLIVSPVTPKTQRNLHPASPIHIHKHTHTQRHTQTHTQMSLIVRIQMLVCFIFSSEVCVCVNKKKKDRN